LVRGFTPLRSMRKMMRCERVHVNEMEFRMWGVRNGLSPTSRIATMKAFRGSIALLRVINCTIFHRLVTRKQRVLICARQKKRSLLAGDENERPFH
jgi:hypothetical protein